jgi:hypothetical protein
MDELKESIDLEINGQLMSKDTYEIKKFVKGGIKIVAVYHDQEGFKEED